MTVVQIRDAIGSRLAYEYLKRKISLTKIAPHSKRPVEKDWQTKFYAGVECASAFVDHNIGFILGKSSGSLTDIDLDCQEAIDLAPFILPNTSWVFGRQSARKSHYMYNCFGSKTQKFVSPMKEGGMILEIRSDGAQTVAPGSIHPSGEAVQFNDESWKNYKPYELTFVELQQCCGDLAAACLLLRHGWSPGKRDEIAVSICGLLLRMGRDHNYIDNFLGGIAHCAGDEELDMRLKADYQAKRLEANEKVPGIPTLINVLGQDLASRIVDWMGVKSLNMVHEFNQEIGVICMGNTTRVILDGGYYSDQEPKFLKTGEAKILYQSRGTVMVDKGKVQVPKYKFDVWLESPDRRNYSNIVFAPQGTKESEYNLWKGWPIAPQDNPQGCFYFLKHVKEVICSGEEDLYNYVITWLADAVQNVCDKPGVCMVLQGSQGTGKSMFAEYIMGMYGKYGLVSTNSDYLFGKHNFHLANKLMVFADESCWAGNKHHASVLNNMITSKTMSFEPKGVNLITIDNYLRLMMATNDEWAVPASGTARRFFIVRVSDKYRDNRQYFEQLAFEMENEGPECLLGYLQNFKIQRNLRNIPQTSAITQNKLLTAIHNNPVLGWWIQRLNEELPTRHCTGWNDVISVSDLYKDYFYSTGVNKNDRGNQVSFGMLFKTLIPDGVKITKRRVNGQLKRFYRLPSLEDCRDYVANYLIKEPHLFEKDWGI